LKDDTRRAVTIGINECFQPIPVPDEDDWLSIHEECGQTVQEFEQTPRTIPYPRYLQTFSHSFMLIKGSIIGQSTYNRLVLSII
jgi:hypothetical protein